MGAKNTQGFYFYISIFVVNAVGITFCIKGEPSVLMWSFQLFYLYTTRSHNNSGEVLHK